MPLSLKLILLNLASLAFIFTLIHFYVFPFIEGIFVESYKTKIRNTVEVVDHLVKDFHAKELRGELTQLEAQTLAKQAISSLRYEKSEYFWIHDLELKMVMHPTQTKLDGQDISQMKDPEGVAIFVEMNKIVASQDGGFLHYMWPKPGSDVPVEKYSYVKVFKSWGWIVGSGIYFDTIRSTMTELRWSIYGGLGFAALLSFIGTFIFSHRLVENMRKVLKSLNDSGLKLTSLSSELAKTGNTVSEGVSSSASSITETSASMEEIGLMSQKNEDNSSLTQSAAENCLKASHEGKDIVKHLSECISKISQSNNDVLDQNSASSKRIAEIIDVIKEIREKTNIINDIVFQTKLLSFNASVEAARAGEAGKGFAVVAEEVGKLAEMSGQAAQDIESSLKESVVQVEGIVQNDLAQSQEIIKRASEQVKEGIEVTNKCEKIFSQILQQITDVVEHTNHISSSCQEQRIGFEQINTAILQLNNASNSNAKAAIEVSESVEKMVEQAEQVQNYTHLITTFIEGNKAA